MKTLLFLVIGFLGALSGLAQDPCTPASAAAGNITATSAVITWQPGQQPGISYIFEYRQAPSGSWTGVAITGTSYTLTNLLPATTYDFRVSGSCSKPGNYAAGSFTTLAVCTNSFEPNNTESEAPEVGINATIYAAINSQADVDFYIFAAPGCGTFTITLQNLPANYALAVIDPSGEVVTSSDNSGTTDESITLSMARANTITVRVTSSDGSFSNTCYQLTTLAVPNPPADCSNNYEPNQTQAAAVSIPLNTHIYAAIGSPDDQDYYSFTLTQMIWVDITLQDLPGDYQLELYDASGTYISGSYDGLTHSEIISLTLPPGTYIIRVYPLRPVWWCQSLCYDLKATVDYGCINPPDQQPNNSLESAVTIPGIISFNGAINPQGDVDYYRFSFSYSKALVDILLYNLPADYKLTLMHSNGAIISVSDHAGTQDEYLFKQLSAGTYIIKVEGTGLPPFTPWSPACYTLDLAVEPKPMRIQDEAISEAEATGIYPNPFNSRLTVQQPGAGPGTNCTIFNLQGRAVMTRRLAGGSGIFNTAALAPGVYLVKLFNEKGVLISQRKIVKQ